MNFLNSTRFSYRNSSAKLARKLLSLNVHEASCNKKFMTCALMFAFRGFQILLLLIELRGQLNFFEQFRHLP